MNLAKKIEHNQFVQAGDRRITPRFPIGLIFELYSVKHNRDREILDIYTTRNQAGAVVRVEYLVGGHGMTELMVDTTIARSLGSRLQEFV